MTEDTSTLDRWRRVFDRLESCPWPGPRPLRGDDGDHLLLGRDADRERFRSEVDRFRLVLLTGSSGVGKTSLIEAGLIPELRTAGGYTVALCRDWSGGAEETDPVAFLAAKVRSALEEGGYTAADSEGAALFWDLEKALPGRAVLVLDQFEELIRDAGDLTDRLYPLLVELNHRTSIKIVISFRSEFINELKPLETKAKPFTISHIQLAPVAPEYASAVVEAGNHGAEAAITGEAAERIAQRWRKAYGQQSGQGRLDRFGRIGLLHLQALLYALHGRSPEGVIDLSMVEQIDQGDEVELFSHGMREAIVLKLDRCRDAATALELDPYLTEGAASFVTRSVGHLSSVGYKLVRGVYDLWAATLEQQIDSLPRPHEDLLHAVTSTILLDNRARRHDLLDTTRDEFATAADADSGGVGQWAERVRWDPDDGELSHDPGEVTCGPMMGMPPAAVLVEELRRYAFALDWLQASSLIRISTPGRQGAMISLIHDGFGAALERWSESAAEEPMIALSAITAPRGGQFVWQVDRDPAPAHPELDGTQAPALLTNLRWKGGWVRSSFRQVQFVNCDLRGAAFDNCVFTGVSFVNCLLDGAMFTNCLIVGAPGPSVKDYDEDPPEFVLEAPRGLVESIAKYREVAGASALLSPLPGLPAVPASGPAEGQVWAPETGGLTFYGGRVSSLVLRANRFADDGTVSFRQIAGSGLEIVEQEVGSFEVAGSRLRHLTISAPAGAIPEEEKGGIKLRLLGSVVTQAWLSDTIGGTLKADNCTLVQIWNGSAHLEAVADNCAHFDLVNVALGDNCAPVDPIGEPASLTAADPTGRIGDLARGMDYRRNPAAAILAERETEG